jgi:hypothetical protein
MKFMQGTLPGLRGADRSALPRKRGEGLDGMSETKSIFAFEQLS